MANFLRVNMSNGSVTAEPCPEHYNLLGGRGLTSQLIFEEVDPTTYPLGDGNKMVIAPGLLTGTTAPSSGRLSIGAKSPLTGGIKESNAGGTAARKLARLGIKAIILEGRAKVGEWFVLKVSSVGAELLPAGDLVGLGNYATVDKLRTRFGEKVGLITIGPAGEKLMAAASVAVTDPDGRPSRHCGRGGMGAVMGSKGLKAVVIDDAEAHETLLDLVDPSGFNEIARRWSKTLSETRKGLTNFGTASLVKPISAVGGLPTRNFSRGTFEGADNINGEVLAERAKARGGKTGHACSPGCVIRCSNVYHDQNGQYLTSGLEYETIVLLGANCEIDDLDAIAELDRLCDDYGLDTMEMGHTMAVAMEAGLLPFGDVNRVKELLGEIASGTVLGRILGQGAAVTGRVFNVARVPVVKGQGMAAYDPRALKGTGITYATSPMGADHTAGNCLPGRGGVDPNKREGQVKVSRELQIMSTVIDALGLCLFVGPLPDSMEMIAQLLSMARGTEVTVADLLSLGQNILRTEIAFNRRAGLTSTDDRLPVFFRQEKLAPYELVFDVSDEELDEVLNF